MGGGFMLLPLEKLFLPQVVTTDTKVPFREKLISCVIYLFIFLLYILLPKHSTTVADLFYWMRVIVASNHGTLFQLGITPIVISEMDMMMAMIFLDGSKIIQSPGHLQFKKEFAILIALHQALVPVLSGMYGSVNQLGIGIAILITIQLFFLGIIVKCLYELLQKRYCLGSGISLFMAMNICENIIWKAFSPTTVNTRHGAQFEGFVIALFHMLITRTNKLFALRQAFYRQNLPNLANLLATVIIFLIVMIYFQLKSKNAQGQGQKGSDHPIMNIILQYSLVFIPYPISRFLYRKFTGTVSDYGTSHSIHVCGIAYCTNSPSNSPDMAANPLYALLYHVSMLVGLNLNQYGGVQESRCSWAANLFPRDLLVFHSF